MPLFLSRIILSNLERKPQRTLRDIHSTHRLVMQGFQHIAANESSNGRVLFRVEPEPSHEHRGTSILVQSPVEPKWTPEAEAVIAHIDPPRPLEPALDAGQVWRYRLRANPTVARSKTRKREALLMPRDQLQWLGRKADAGGFRVRTDPDHADAHLLPMLIDEDRFTGSKGNGTTITCFSVRFEGLLEVTDPASFYQSLANGIGPAKGLGFGLLSLARP